MVLVEQVVEEQVDTEQLFQVHLVTLVIFLSQQQLFQSRLEVVELFQHQVQIQFFQL